MGMEEKAIDLLEQLNIATVALVLACNRVKEDNPALDAFGFDLKDYYLKKAKEEVERTKRMSKRDEEW